ncbi:MAG: hypothetical protein MJ246_05795 [Clostridia bacterium]|nr:hypothetical protein [Clostridia bacterium]
MYAIDANGNCTGAKFRLYVQLRDKYTSQNPPSTGYLVSDEVGIKPQNVKQTFLGDSNDSYIYDKTAHYAPWKALPDSGKIKAV